MHSFGPRLDAEIFSTVSSGSHSDNENLRFPRFRILSNLVMLASVLATVMTFCAGRVEGATGTLSATPSPIGFGTVATGAKNSQTVQLKNTGAGTLSISSATVSGSYFSSSGISLPKTLLPGATTSLTLYFAPLAVGSHSGSLVLKSSASDATLTVPLSGSGSATVRTLSLSSTTVNFGSEAVGQTATEAITVKNTGNTSVTMGKLTVGGTGFSVSGGLNLATLAPGQSGTLDVHFAPSSTGSFSGKVTIPSNASNSPEYITLTGVSRTSHNVALRWSASSTLDVVGYHVYRSTQSGGPYSRISSTLLTVLSYTDGTVSAGETYYYVVTAVTPAGEESKYSAQITATIP